METKENEKEKEKINLPFERRPHTPTSDEESMEIGPYLICLDEDCKKNPPRMGPRYPQPKPQAEEEECSKSNNGEEHGILQPYVLNMPKMGAYNYGISATAQNLHKSPRDAWNPQTMGFLDPKRSPSQAKRSYRESKPSQETKIGLEE